jgi:hypothetical protein
LKQAVKRAPIDDETVETLLRRSNYLCAVCKGMKGTSYIIHHIVPHEVSQNNSYANLIVLCPNDHDMAHQSGLAMRITKEQLHLAKWHWEQEVELHNAQAAAREIKVSEGSIHFANVRRIEELCLNLFGSMPETTMTQSLRAQNILNTAGLFNEVYVRKHLSNGRFLFNYFNAGETRHYRELMKMISGKIDFSDLSNAIDHGVRTTKAMQGKYAYFIGGVRGRGPDFPITPASPPMLMHYKKRRVRVEWQIDPNFVMSNTSYGMLTGSVHLIVYCFVQSIGQDSVSKDWLVRAQPLLIAHPLISLNKKPGVAYDREHEKERDDLEDGSGEEDLEI